MNTFCLQLFSAVTAVAVTSATALAGLPPAQTSCYTIPATRISSAKTGDIILTTSGGGVIRDLISSIGQDYTHTGVAVSSSSVRHNSMDVGGVERTYSWAWAVVPNGLKATGSNSLREGAPGMATTPITQNGWYASSSMILSGPSAYSSKRATVANEMSRMDGHYRLYAYTDMAWPNPTERTSNQGNMCSGTVMHAMFRTGIAPNTMRQSYTADVRNAAAQVLYDAVRKKVINGVDGWQDFFTRDARIEGVAEDVANQVVNCMGFNDCGNKGGRWRNGVGTGSTISPDDLMLVMAAYAFVSAFAGVPNTFPYQTAEKVKWTPSQYCCVTPPLGALPSQTTCS